MAVPKRKKSKSRRNMRRGSNGSYSLEIANVLTDKTTGEFKLPHHISLDGYYDGREIIKKKQKKSAQEE
ncbi:MAG: 50S ribosomal protein L32 [Proteobacteria bacterium]|nr:50S ribosomal protein L32 [Pseudomonadota bacterium]